MVRRTARSIVGISFPLWAMATLFVPTLCGCLMPGLGYRENPLSTLDQQREVEKIVPPGTSRAEVESRLKIAGIEVSPGTSPRIAYCDVWNRSGKGRWVMNVALLFDENGKLVGTRPANSPTETSDERSANSSMIAEREYPDGSARPISDPAINQASAEQISPVSQPVQGSASGRRVPFEESKPAYAP